ncbi:unnamed protein product [Closterium sp. NIES-53]
MWAYPLKQKEHAASTIQEDWLPFVEKQAECVVKRIRTDRGGEFVGAKMTQEAGHSEEADHGLHPTVQRKPPVDMLRVFDCMAVAHVPKKYRSKLGASAIWCVHLGLAAESKGWLQRESSKDVLFDSTDVNFVEGMMYGGWKKQPETKVSQQMEQITMQLDLTRSVREEGEEAAAEGGDGEKRGGGGGTLGGEKLVLFLVYVVDILLFSSSMKDIQRVQQQLMKNLKCKTLGEVKYYLGMHVERDLDHKCLKLHQEKFIKELGEKYKIKNERKVAIPLPAEFKLVKAAEDEGVEAEEQLQFQSLVCSLLYAAVHTRPDISFLVGQLARVVQNPSEEQVHAAERVVKSLNSHPSIGVQYSASAQVKQKGVEVLKEKGEWLGEGKLFLTCFTDAMWASLKDDSSSVGGYICVVGVGPDGWRPKKQTETALSSVESEHMAMFYRVEEVIWLRRLLEEIGQEQKVATPLFCDNKGALGMARNAVLHGLNKHMRIKWHWLRKEVKRGTVNRIYIKTHQQPADFLTKRLADEPHWRCVRMSGMCWVQIHIA